MCWWRELFRRRTLLLGVVPRASFLESCLKGPQKAAPRTRCARGGGAFGAAYVVTRPADGGHDGGHEPGPRCRRHRHGSPERELDQPEHLEKRATTRQ